MERVPFVDHEIRAVLEFADGTRFPLYADLDRLEAAMKSAGPEDGRLIDAFIRATRRFQRARIPLERPLALFSPLDYLKLARQLPLALAIWRWRKLTPEAFAGRFQSPLLRRVVRHFSSPESRSRQITRSQLWKYTCLSSAVKVRGSTGDSTFHKRSPVVESRAMMSRFSDLSR